MRLEHVYGPRDGEHKLIPYIVKSIIDKKYPIKLTDGIQKRDFIYIKDVIAAFITVLRSRQSLSDRYYEYEVGSGKAVELRTMLELIRDCCIDKNAETVFDFGAIERAKDDILFSQADTTLIKNLGWIPVYSLSFGVQAYVKWIKEQQS
jgi:nucleoside-diphosphate-sugar epimerase